LFFSVGQLANGGAGLWVGGTCTTAPPLARQMCVWDVVAVREQAELGPPSPPGPPCKSCRTLGEAWGHHPLTPAKALSTTPQGCVAAATPGRARLCMLWLWSHHWVCCACTTRHRPCEVPALGPSEDSVGSRVGVGVAVRARGGQRFSGLKPGFGLIVCQTVFPDNSARWLAQPTTPVRCGHALAAVVLCGVESCVRVLNGTVLDGFIQRTGARGQ
jgi:hypothetical protein